ncbi:methyl-accepting chemotaxis protein [Rhodoferax sp. 4810]|uniref:Methyl-accepting chemotaxis protein n=1 Tax=Thiospirillum jenense TaxID=1653858 RepID=A0A839H296_9GAMM|nr:methyl-accepting chemotaxis protein [Thiospirillum jenense]MBB1073186.1 methyl-accepting chemotaxis protein [Rhodoferax jenense]MBB1124653.1 methyl-accepting chemotaxis protein [Thiospirillum jenense]
MQNKYLTLPIRLLLAVITINLVTAIVFTTYTYTSQAQQIMRGIDAKLLTTAAGVKLVMDEFHQQFAINHTVTPDEYQHCMDELSMFANEAQVEYVYTIISQEQHIVFTASSYTEKEKAESNFTEFLSVYDDASDSIAIAIETQQIQYDEYSDKWGTFRSVFVPAQTANGYRYVIGVDISLADITATLNQVLVNCILIALGVFVMGILVSLFLMRFINNTLESFAAAVNEIANGHLNITVSYPATDQLGILAIDINRMADNLRLLINTMQQSADQVATTAEQLSATSEQISNGTNQVAGHLTSVAAATEQMSATAAEIAQNCITAANEARHASLSANSGVAIVIETIDAMHCIADHVKQTAEQLTELNIRSNEIGKISALITSIARQTNLLALNAAIEAANAGQYGKGFAVVADEVRTLADQTTQAAANIIQIIATIQGGTQAAVSAIDAGLKNVAQGTASASHSSTALQMILEQIDTVTAQVDQISAAAEEQTVTTVSISQDIHYIAEVVQQTALDSQCTSQATQQLAELAGHLRQ